MKNHTRKANRERLSEKVDGLTEENQRHFLGVLEALLFAQTRVKLNLKQERAVYPLQKG